MHCRVFDGIAAAFYVWCKLLYLKFIYIDVDAVSMPCRNILSHHHTGIIFVVGAILPPVKLLV